MEFPGSADTFLTISDSGHPFLSGAETFHTPSLGDEEFEIPPISLPLETDPDVACHFDLNDPASSQDNGFSTQFSSAPLELSLPLSQGVMEQGSGLMGSLNMDLGQTVGTQFGPEAALTPGVSVVTHNPLTTIDQSELSSQLGLSLGGPEILSPAPAPTPGDRDRGSPTPSPASSTHEEEGEDFRRAAAERPPPAEGGRRAKGKRRRRKDPNEPQKPVSAYALFFRDTQAAIKGQNPTATFGEVSKIVASMWDSLGEEQKQIYKRKTEAAKKEYLKALASYRAGLESKTADSSDAETLQAGEETLASPAPLLVNPPTTCPPAPACQVPGVGQGLVTVLAPAPQLLQLQLPLPSGPRLQRLQAPPPLQPMPPPPLQAVPPRPPPLQAAAQHRLRPAPQPPPPPPLQVQIIQLQPLAPAAPLAPPSLGPPPATTAHQRGSETGTAAPRQQAEVQVQSSPQAQVELVTSSPPPPSAPAPGSPVCVRSGCSNCPVPSADWDNEYCSSECVVQHCRDVFMAWVSARNPSPVTSVK